MTHKHFKIILVTLLCLCGKEISAKKIEVQSPDGKLKVNIELKDKYITQYIREKICCWTIVHYQ